MKHPIERNPHSGMIALILVLFLLIMIILGVIFSADVR